jgi:hypothetical protein
MHSILCCPHADRILRKLPALRRRSGLPRAWRKVRSEKCHNFNMTVCTTGELRSKKMNWEGRTARMRWELPTKILIWKSGVNQSRGNCVMGTRIVLKWLLKVIVCVCARERETIRFIAAFVRTACGFSRAVQRLYSEECLSPVVLLTTLNFL